jgi:DNA replication protein DnaC/transposase
MQEWTEIRRKVLVEGASKRSTRRDYGIAFETLQKILSHPEPPGYRQRAPRPQTKLGPYLPAIEEILASDRDAPPEQHHTAKRIFERLRDEHGYQGGLTQVRVAVAAYRRRAQEVFVPLRHPPGEAQFDFGYATVRIGGRDSKAAFAVMSLPYSDAFHVSAYPRECTETFQAAHVAAFRFFGGVPRRISYDNSKIAVKKVMGRERELTREFLRLQSHHLFTHRFCRVARGNEKGHVEGLVGYSRRNFMVPVPEASSFAELNNRLEARCRADLDRTLWGATKTKAELLEDDRAAMLPLPVTFEARRVVQTRANSLSLVRFDRNDYSVPTSFAHHELVVVGGIEEVRIACRDQLVARHPRSWEREQVRFDPVHYLGLLEVTELELLERERKAAERRLKAARFPALKSLESFDFAARPSVNRALISELARGQYIERRENVLFVGNPRTGKTHLGIALAAAACATGYRVRFYRVTELVTLLIEARDERTLLGLKGRLAKLDLLVLDEFGYVPATKVGAELLFDVISTAYERTSLMVTTNLPFDHWTEVLGSERLTGATLDRLTHRCQIIETGGGVCRSACTGPSLAVADGGSPGRPGADPQRRLQCQAGLRGSGPPVSPADGREQAVHRCPWTHVPRGPGGRGDPDLRLHRGQRLMSTSGSGPTVRPRGLRCPCRISSIPRRVRMREPTGELR